MMLRTHRTITLTGAELIRMVDASVFGTNEQQRQSIPEDAKVVFTPKEPNNIGFERPMLVISWDEK